MMGVPWCSGGDDRFPGGQRVSGIGSAWCVRMARTGLGIRKTRITPVILVRIMRIGFPAGLQSVVYSFFQPRDRGKAASMHSEQTRWRRAGCIWKDRQHLLDDLVMRWGSPSRPLSDKITARGGWTVVKRSRMSAWEFPVMLSRWG
ncbi:MAG: hypothetical protein ACLT76_01460 [Clostridium fessum]